MSKKGQLSIIAALLVAVVLVATVIATYSIIRSNPIEDQPPIQSAIDEINFGIKQILGFTVGYYGSVLKVTGNSSYAKMLATNYLQSGLENMANMHPEWATSLEASNSELYTNWFTNTSYSRGNLAVKYNLTGLGISGVNYATSCKLSVYITNSSGNQACLKVTKDEGEPVINLGKQNFKFFKYENINSTWELVSPSIEPIAYANGTYQIYTPPSVDLNSYLIQVEDSRGIIAVGSSFSRYTFTLNWSPPTGSKLQDTTLVAELLQNGTLRWLGQNLNNQTQTKPVPPIPVKLIHVNQTINNVSCEVPFQIEEWASEYRIPLGRANNESVFNSRTMLVFLVNPKVSNVTTIWWDGNDTTTQTPNAYVNHYFQDSYQNNILTNGRLTLNLKKLSDEYLYVDGFNNTIMNWTAFGGTPYLNDNSANYIYTNVSYRNAAWFSFQNPTYYGISSAEIQFECNCSGNDYFNFTISDGISTYNYSVTGLLSSYEWKKVDIYSKVNNWEKVTNAKIRITYLKNGGTADTVYIRRARLYIKYDPNPVWGIESTLGNTTLVSEFFRGNSKRPKYGSDLAYTIYNGTVRDIVVQEAEWGNGIDNCPNVYSYVVITLPANCTYYTYSLRTIFADTNRSRSLADFSTIQLRMSYTGSELGGGWGQTSAENGTISNLPNSVNVSNQTATLCNFTSSQTGWMHHWAQFSKNAKGGGIMVTDLSNLQLYAFDKIANNSAGALNVTDSLRDDGQSITIEFNPVSAHNASFQNAMDLSWCGAVVNFDNTDPIYKLDDGNAAGLWISVEYPPTITTTVGT